MLALVQAGEQPVQQRHLAALCNQLLCRGILDQILFEGRRQQVWVVGHLSPAKDPIGRLDRSRHASLWLHQFTKKHFSKGTSIPSAILSVILVCSIVELWRHSVPIVYDLVLQGGHATGRSPPETAGRSCRMHAAWLTLTSKLVRLGMCG